MQMFITRPTEERWGVTCQIVIERNNLARTEFTQTTFDDGETAREERRARIWSTLAVEICSTGVQRMQMPAQSEAAPNIKVGQFSGHDSLPSRVDGRSPDFLNSPNMFTVALVNVPVRLTNS